MWSLEQSVVTPAPAAAVFALWADVPSWPSWDTSLIATTFDGPFAAGSAGTLHPEGAPGPLPFVITAVDPGAGFTDETPFGEVLLRFVHRAEPVEGGTRVTLRVEVEGPGAQEVGEMVTSDLPDALAALTAAAERASAAA